MLVEERILAGFRVLLAIPDTPQEWHVRGYSESDVLALAQSAFVVAVGAKVRDEKNSGRIQTAAQARDYAAGFTRTGQIEVTSLAFVAGWDDDRIVDLCDGFRSQGKVLANVPALSDGRTWDSFGQRFVAPSQDSDES